MTVTTATIYIYIYSNAYDPRQPDATVHALEIPLTATQRTEEKNTWEKWVSEHSHSTRFFPPRKTFPLIFEISQISSGRHFLVDPHSILTMLCHCAFLSSMLSEELSPLIALRRSPRCQGALWALLFGSPICFTYTERPLLP